MITETIPPQGRFYSSVLPSQRCTISGLRSSRISSIRADRAISLNVFSAASFAQRLEVPFVGSRPLLFGAFGPLYQHFRGQRQVLQSVVKCLGTTNFKEETSCLEPLRQPVRNQWPIHPRYVVADMVSGGDNLQFSAGPADASAFFRL